MAAGGVPVELDGGKLLYIGTDGQGVELEIVAWTAEPVMTFWPRMYRIVVDGLA